VCNINMLLINRSGKEILGMAQGRILIPPYGGSNFQTDCRLSRKARNSGACEGTAPLRP
jgi:hypothetical protein